MNRQPGFFFETKEKNVSNLVVQAAKCIMEGENWAQYQTIGQAHVHSDDVMPSEII